MSNAAGHNGDGTESGLQAQFRLRHPGTHASSFTLDVDLTLPGQGITAIFGQSGSGKTTLLRCVAGLERPEQGRLTANGETWQDKGLFLPTHRRPLAYVFQESSLFPHLTAQGNLDYATARCHAACSKALYDQVIALMGIEGILHRHPAQLSGGERQRVSIARALLIQPRLLLMDEPLASLDFARKQEILPYLEKLKSTFDLPILYVSHSLDEVARLADQLVLLEQGRTVAQGAAAELFSRIDLPWPSGNEFGVVWQGEVVERNEQWHLARLVCQGSELWVRDAGEALGQQVRVRIMARDVSLALACHEDSSILNRLPVTVEDIAPDRDHAMALVRLRAGSNHVIARITYRSIDHLQLLPGKQLWAQIKSVAIVR